MTSGPARSASSPFSFRGAWWKWALLPLIALVVSEATVRVEDRITDGIPFLSRVASPNDLVVIDSAGPRGRPNAAFRRWRLNSLGMRSPDVPVARTPNTLRVVIAGSSETFGLYEPNGLEYPRQVEDSLQVRLSTSCATETAPRAEVVNAALPGMALPSLSQHLDREVRPLRPDVVVLYPSPGFYLNMRAPTAQQRTRPDTALRADKARQLRIVSRFVDQIKALVPGPLMTAARRMRIDRVMRRYPPGVKYDSVPTDRLQQFERDLRNVVGVARRTGARVVMMGHVNATMAPDFRDDAMLVAWEVQFPRATGDVLSRFHAAALDVQARVAADSGVAFLDLRPAIAAQWSRSFADFVHFSEYGASVVAGALTPLILATSGACKEAGGGG